MTSGARATDVASSVAARALLTARLAARWPAARRLPHDATALVVAVGDAHLTIRIDALDAPRAAVRFRSVSLSYAIQGALGDHEAEARRIVNDVARHVRALDAVVVHELPEALERVGVDGDDERLRHYVTPDLAARKDALFDHVVSLHHRSVSAWAEGPVPTVEGLPECLSIELRPVVPRGPRTVHDALPTPCDACAVASCCTGAHSLDVGVARLRPLRHADATSAVWSALRALAGAFDTRIPAAVERFVLEAIADRRGVGSTVATPFELSIKIRDDRLVPSVRIVEYSPPHIEGEPSPRVREARRASVVRRAADIVAAEARQDLDTWLELVARHETRGIELSIGLEVTLGAAPDVALQLYAHIEPMSEPAARALLADALAFSGIDDAQRDALMQRIARSVALGGGSSPLTLLAYSPTSSERRRQKLYLTTPVVSDPDALGGALPSFGPLAPYAPARCLAVYDVDGQGVVARKRDFPCTAHFQVSAPMLDAFASTLVETERTSFARLLDGREFAAWPTWLSVGSGMRTLYFVPR